MAKGTERSETDEEQDSSVHLKAVVIAIHSSQDLLRIQSVEMRSQESPSVQMLL